MSFDLFWYDYIRILISIFSVLTIPGWALLTITDYWRNWATLQRWCVAIGLSIAFYPILFYWSRTLFPSLQIGPNKNMTILLVAGSWTAWRLRHDWKSHFKFDKLEWFAILVFIGTLFTRYWIAYTHPFPAWSDSLHHTLLTQLTGNSGQLPYTLEPYAPTPLDMYHLGLYALTGTIQQLAAVPAHTALLWMAQTLNGLCTIGVYLVLDRKAGRVGAITGAAVVGLWSHMPAWYVNWGRFTQVASQAILLIAWIIIWEALEKWRDTSNPLFKKFWVVFLAGAMNAAVFLLHFRVFGLYLPLFFITVLVIFFKKEINQRRMGVIRCCLFICIISIILVLPNLYQALITHIEQSNRLITFILNSEAGPDFSYYRFNLHSIPQLAAKPFLLATTILGSSILLVKKNTLGLIIIVWSVIMVGLGNLYLLNLPYISFTNIGAVLIMFYLPIGLILGITAMYLYRFGIKYLPPERLSQMWLIVIIGFGIMGANKRISGLEVEDHRYFVSNVDLKAMNWIQENTSVDSTFGITTYLWVQSFPHGLDGGYWIPYFTHRSTNTNTMLTPLEIGNFYIDILEKSQATYSAQTNANNISKLLAFDIDYLYDSTAVTQAKQKR